MPSLRISGQYTSTPPYGFTTCQGEYLPLTESKILGVWTIMSRS